MEKVKEITRKVSEEQLEKLQKFVGAINEGQLQLGGLEMQKADVLSQIAAIRSELNEVQAELKEEFGDVTIDIKTGEVTDADHSQD
jgi:Mg2+ and Co2+ transporter CorA